MINQDKLCSPAISPISRKSFLGIILRQMSQHACVGETFEPVQSGQAINVIDQLNGQHAEKIQKKTPETSSLKSLKY